MKFKKKKHFKLNINSYVCYYGLNYLIKIIIKVKI